MAVTEEIRERLEAAFRPRHLLVEDESESHRGHSGWKEGGETHFAVTMAAEDLGPLSRVERHRAVHSALGPELIARIHALRLTLSA